MYTASRMPLPRDNSSTRRHGGVGLGLHLCHTLIQHMGGQLQVESELGVGSRFFFEIPAPRAIKA